MGYSKTVASGAGDGGEHGPMSREEEIACERLLDKINGLDGACTLARLNCLIERHRQMEAKLERCRQEIAEEVRRHARTTGELLTALRMIGRLVVNAATPSNN